MRYQSNVLKRSKYEIWIMLFLAITFIIDLVAVFYADGLEGTYFLAYRLSGIITVTLLIMNEIAKYKQSNRKVLLFSIAVFTLILSGLIVSTIQTLV